MNETPISQTVDEQIALYACGALTQEEHEQVEAKLQAGWEEGEAAWSRYENTVAALLDGTPVMAPPASVKEKLLAQLPVTKAAKAKPHGISFRHQQNAKFVSTPHPGITIRMLHMDKEARQFTALMRLAPGARYPSHHHDGAEECLVLEGSLMVGDTRMVAGDYQRCEVDSDHVDQWSDTGALLYINAPLSMLAA